MRNTVFVQLHNLHDADHITAEWIDTDPSGSLSTIQQGTLAELAHSAGNRRVVLFIPGTDTVITHTTIPTRNKQRLLKAIPYALEDQLLDDVETMHFAVGTRNTDGTVPVIAIAKQRMQQWLSLLETHNLQPYAIIPAPLCVPWQRHEWHAIVDGSGGTVRTGKHSGFITDHNTFAQLCLLELDHAESKPEKLVITQQSVSLDSATLLAQLASRDIEAVEENTDKNRLQLLAEGYIQSPAINLLQGEYNRSDASRRHLRSWYPAAAILMVLLLLQVFINLIELYQLNSKNMALNTEIEQLFHKALPDVKRIVNPKVQMEQRLASLQGATSVNPEGFLPLLNKTGSLLASTPGLILNGLRYQGGQLDLELTTNNLQTLEQLKARIATIGLTAEIRSATRQEQQVTSQIRIKGGTS